jgi:hypothetical protein
MGRRLLAVTVVTVILAACGGSTPTESPVPPSPASTQAPPATATAAPVATAPPATAAPTTRTAACNGIAVRKSPSLSGQAVSRLARGTKVRVVDVVTGDAYTTGACGTPGNTWYRINRVGGKSTKSLYGVSAVYAAAGLFQ